MRKGKARIVLGVILIVLQIVSIIGSLKLGDLAPMFPNSVFDMVGSIGYYLIGIIGLGLLIWGIVAFSCSKGCTDNADDVYNYYHDKHN